MQIWTRRAYDEPSPQDGQRVLVDRLWPRGVSKERARLDAWAKEVAPSDELRRWYHAHPDRWDEFRRRYREELADREGVLQELLDRAREGRLTLVYSSRETERNNAVALKEIVEERLRG